MTINIVNEHRPELASSAGFNPTIAHDSSARVQMLGSHLSQALPVADCQTRRILTGMEREFGRATFKIEFPVDAEIYKVIPKFQQTLGQGGIKSNPTTAIVYMDVESKVFDVLEFNHYHSMHQHFGFQYVISKPTLRRLVPRSCIEAGTVLGHSPTLDEMENYRIGLNARVAMMSVPGIIEDGIVASESFCKRLTTRCIESRDTSWGKNWYPLNLYGDDTHYKPFPDIGDKIRDDGLIFALRRVPQDDDVILSVLEMSKESLREVDYFFDRCVYGQPGATVINITARHEENSQPPTPAGMEVQAAKYYQAESAFHQELLNCHRQLSQKYGDKLRISPKFQAMLREAMMYLPCATRVKSTQMYQLQPLDDWRIDLTYEYDFEPTIGSKLTGLHGDKGVICQKWKDEDMPVDAWGNRAEVIVAASSTMDRMNLGRPYEHETYGSMEMLTDALRDSFNWDRGPEDLHAQEQAAKVREEMAFRGHPKPAGQQRQEEIAAYVNGDYGKAFEVLLDFYKTVSPPMYEKLTSPAYQGNAEYHVKEVLRKGIFVWVPLDSPKTWINLSKDDGTPVTPDELAAMPKDEHKKLKIGGIIGDLTRKYPARRGPVWYRGRSGQESVTQDDIMLADSYMILLEKTGGDWSGVASARHQHYGLPAKLSKQDKYSLPSRANPVRIFGESEVRLLTTATANDVVADVLEMSNSPSAHKNVCENILRADRPSNIEEVLDRKKIPKGSNRSQVFVAHALQCAGIEFVYVDHSDEEEIYPLDPIGGMRDMGLGEEDEPEVEEVEVDSEAEVDEDAEDTDEAEVEE